MKLLLDQGLPRGAVAELLRRGHDVVHTGDVGLARATDEQVLERAKLEGRVVVTLGAIALAQLVATIVDSIADDLTSGAVATSDGARVRLPGLPLR